MKTIKVLFTIGFLNFMLMLGVFSASTIVNQKKPAVTTPVPIVTQAAASPTVTQTKKPAVAVTLVPTKATITAAPTATTAPTSTVAPTTVPTTDPLAGKCIIQIDGVKYNVTEFRNQHSGGDVFTCGTDMSAIFHGRHPDSFLQKMAQYRI